MKRDVEKLKEKEFDLCVIGGGIYGACVAWDAVLRGLSVALIEKDDFGHATTFNSQKTIHGGFRYLQNFDFPRVVSAAKERRAWMDIAPHLVHPLPFLVPTTKKLTRSKPAFFVAFLIYHLLTKGSNRSNDPQKIIPFGKLLSLKECGDLFPMFNLTDINGGALFYDGLIHNSERLVLSIIKSSIDAGAVITNYTEASGFIKHNNCIVGVKAHDFITGDDFNVRSKIVVNTTGPWVNDVNREIGQNFSEGIRFLKVWYLMLKKPQLKCAVGFPAENGKHYFMLPWHDKTLIGAAESTPDEVDYTDVHLSNIEIEKFLNNVNRNCPKMGLKNTDVLAIRGGMLPADMKSIEKGDPCLSEKTRIINHANEGKTEGLISVVSIKFTMARKIAQQIIDLSLSKLGRKYLASTTHKSKVSGGAINDFNKYLRAAILENRGNFNEESIQHLVRSYGTEHEEILKTVECDDSLRERVSNHSPVIKAEVVYAARNEMVVKFSDIVFRRTELGIHGYPGYEVLTNCSNLVARELGWSEDKRARELKEVYELFTTPRWGGVRS